MPALEDATLVNAVLDLVIPPEGPHPGAGQLNLAPVLNRLLSPTPALLPLLEAGFDAIQKAPSPPTQAVLERVAAEQPAFVPTLQMFLYVAYYQQPEVLQSHGMSGKPPFPEGRDIVATDAGLLKKLRERGRGE